MEDKIKDADLVITGEGQMDFQTAHGKTPYGVAQVAKKYNVPVIALVGRIGTGVEDLYTKGINTVFSITEGPISLEESIKNGPQLLERTAERVIRALQIF